MENVITLSDFLSIAASGFGCGFIAGFSSWAVSRALHALGVAVTGRGSVRMD